MYEQIESNKRKTWILVILFVIVISLIGWLVGELTDIGFGLVAFALVFSILVALTSYYTSDKIALSVTGARGPIAKNDNPYVYRMVENLAITAGLPTPRVYMIPSQSLNAFATGRDPEHAAVALTTGIVEKLENEELEGVIAHELSHIKNYDIRLMTLVVVLVGTIMLLSDYMFRWGFIFGGRRSNNQVSSWIAILGLVLLLISPIIAELIRLAVSRKREFLADASGALLTRYPEGLASALEKISVAPPMKRASRATAHLFIASPFGGKVNNGFLRLFSTHPPAAERIAALRGMA